MIDEDSIEALEISKVKDKAIISVRKTIEINGHLQTPSIMTVIQEFNPDEVENGLKDVISILQKRIRLLQSKLDKALLLDNDLKQIKESL